MTYTEAHIRRIPAAELRAGQLLAHRGPVGSRTWGARRIVGVEWRWATFFVRELPFVTLEGDSGTLPTGLLGATVAVVAEEEAPR